jgi:hypothetical protein
VLKRRVLYTTGTRRSSRIQGFIDSIAGDLTVETDTVIPTLSFDRNCSCFIPERTQWNQEVKDWIDSDSIEFYTDGSLMDGAAGAEVYEEPLWYEIPHLWYDTPLFFITGFF